MTIMADTCADVWL